MKQKHQYTGEQFVAAYPAGTRIEWHNGRQPFVWLGGVVVQPKPRDGGWPHEPCIYFVMDGEDVDTYLPRVLVARFQHRVRKEVVNEKATSAVAM